MSLVDLLSILKQAVLITGFVFVMMLVIEYINVQTNGIWQDKLSGNRWKQYIFAALLGAIPGCLGAFLVAGTGDQTRVLSVTMWAREEDAIRYGLSGEFERLTTRLKDTFSDLYQWNIALSGDPASTATTSSRGPDVEGYQLVVGRKLK